MKRISKYALYAIISAIAYSAGPILWLSVFDIDVSFRTLMDTPPVAGTVFFGVFMFIYYLVQDFRKSKKCKEAKQLFKRVVFLCLFGVFIKICRVFYH